MSNILLDLLLIQSFSLDGLIEDYRLFFLGLLPSIFVLACIVEYFDRIDTFNLVRRTIISILILTSVTIFYKSSIFASIEIANEKLSQQKQSSLLLLDLFDLNKRVEKIEVEKKSFYKNKNALTGTISFLKYHLFDSFINDGFTTVVYFITQMCLVLIKLVYSLVYYLGYGLIGIPCLLYLFPTMGNILRGAILSFIWCLIVPHILVFILSMIGSEIERGYIAGQVIGGSATGTVLLFLLTLFIAFTPLIAMMIVNGSGMSQVGGIIASIGANKLMSLPKNTVNTGALLATGGTLGPKMQFAKSTASFGSKLLSGSKKKGNNTWKTLASSSQQLSKHGGTKLSTNNLKKDSSSQVKTISSQPSGNLSAVKKNNMSSNKLGSGSQSSTTKRRSINNNQQARTNTTAQHSIQRSSMQPSKIKLKDYEGLRQTRYRRNSKRLDVRSSQPKRLRRVKK
ncbi:MAG: hypothetical protein HON90_00090 [Halobacteriovoraceae bacterium]|nr:hypothetical protein [Halobacteriovoraceae bacterium]